MATYFHKPGEQDSVSPRVLIEQGEQEKPAGLAPGIA